MGSALREDRAVVRASELDGVLVVGLAAGAGGLVWADAVAAALPSLVVLLALVLAPGSGARPAARLRRARIVAILGGCVFFVSALRASRRVVEHERARDALVASRRWPERCELRAEVAASPLFVGGALKTRVRVVTSPCAPPGTLVTLHVPPDASSTPVLVRGDVVDVLADLAPTTRFWNDGGGDPRPSAARRGVILSGGAHDVVRVTEGGGLGAWIDGARSHARARIRATFPQGAEAMARALVLGEDDLDEEDQRAFRQSGLSHLLAVSGMHLVLVVATFVAAVRAVLLRVPPLARRFVPGRVAAALGVPAAWVYAEIAGASGSAVRAAAMTSAALLATVLARPARTPRALGLSVAVMAVADPLVCHDLSFVLSACATLGLLAFSVPIERVLAPLLPSFALGAARLTAASLAASIACAPVLAVMAPELPATGLLANLVAVPLGEAAALPLCLVHGLLASLPRAEQGAADVASGALALVRLVAHVASRGPGLPVPAPTAGQLAILAMGVAFSSSLGGTVTRRRRWALLAVFGVLLLEVVARARGAPTGVLRVTFLDVGQGDAALVDLPDGSAILVDGGGFVGSPIDIGERVLAPELRARRRGALRAVVLSHPHPDHFGGLAGAVAGRSVGAFWDTGQGEAEGAGGAYAALLDGLRARGVPVLRPSDLCGVHEIGGARVEVLAPCPSHDELRGANDNSFVFRITFGSRSFLFVGDAEHEAEAGLVASRASALRADVLKVGHHGSRTSSTPPFVASVSPSVAVVSCGVRNRFGHPTPQALAALGRGGARVYRTDLDGAVSVTTDGRRLDVVVARGETLSLGSVRSAR